MSCCLPRVRPAKGPCWGLGGAGQVFRRACPWEGVRGAPRRQGQLGLRGQKAPGALLRGQWSHVPFRMLDSPAGPGTHGRGP